MKSPLSPIKARKIPLNTSKIPLNTIIRLWTMKNRVNYIQATNIVNSCHSWIKSRKIIAIILCIFETETLLDWGKIKKQISYWNKRYWKQYRQYSSIINSCSIWIFFRQCCKFLWLKCSRKVFDFSVWS